VNGPDLTLSYGPLPEHVVDVRLPAPDAAAGPVPLVLVVHGGFWKAEWDRAHAAPQSAGLAAAGHVVATVEYRRVRMAGGGWPGTLDDVAQLADSVPALVAAALPGRVDPGRTVLVGHSAGGHLVTWAASRHRLPPSSPWHRA
jgi:acetyl esterase/lipase